MSRHRIPGGTGPRGGGGGVPAGPGRANRLRTGAPLNDIAINPAPTTGGVAAPLSYPKLIQPKRWCRNAQIPDSWFRRKTRDAANHVMAYRSKTFAAWGDMVNLVAAGKAVTKDLWRMRCMTGHGASEMRFKIGIASVSDVTGDDPQITISVIKVADGTAQGLSVTSGAASTATLHGGQTAAAIEGPSYLNFVNASIPVLPLTTYEVLISGYDCGAPQAGLIYEWCDPGVWLPTNYYQPQPATVGTPITDADRERMILGASEMWKYKGSHLMQWVGPHSAAGISLATVSNFKNPIDQAVVSSVDASTPGWSHQNAGGVTSTALPALSSLARYKDSGAVPCVFAVYAAAQDGDGAAVRLVDGTGATLTTITNITETAGWWTINFDLATADDLRFVMKATGQGAGGGCTMHAASVYAV